jgi:hypothetical protein
MLTNSSHERYTQKENHNQVLLHKPKLLRFKLQLSILSSVFHQVVNCQVYCCFKLACDVTDFEAYRHQTGVSDTDILADLSVNKKLFSFFLSFFLTFTKLSGNSPLFPLLVPSHHPPSICFTLAMTSPDRMVSSSGNSAS